MTGPLLPRPRQLALSLYPPRNINAHTSRQRNAIACPGRTSTPLNLQTRPRRPRMSVLPLFRKRQQRVISASTSAFSWTVKIRMFKRDCNHRTIFRRPSSSSRRRSIVLRVDSCRIARIPQPRSARTRPSSLCAVAARTMAEWRSKFGVPAADESVAQTPARRAGYPDVRVWS
jgi:hypothetical protein